MKLVVNLILILIVAFLVWMLVGGIKTPIQFKNEKEKREAAVHSKLENIRTCQELYRDITGEFAPTFDTLKQVLMTDSIPFEQVFEDPDDPTNEDKFVYKTIWTNAMDSINAMKLPLDSLSYVPYSGGKQFSIAADTLTYQKTIVWVTECATRYNEFMGPYADVKFSKYDNSYDPDAIVKFGDMGSPNLSGNW